MLPSQSVRRYGWHASSFDPRIASIRLRLLRPMGYLQSQNMDIQKYDAAKGVAHYDAIIFSKSLCADAVEIGRAAKAAGRSVIYDLCDNVFEGKEGKRKDEKISNLRAMLDLADHVVFSTDVLAAQVAGLLPDVARRSRVIPDTMDGPAEPSGGVAGLRANFRLWRLKRFLRRNRGAMNCVWFGKSQGDKSGFTHLDAAVREMAIFAQDHPVTLTIISNKRGRYRKAARNWNIPHHYLSWSQCSFEAALARHEVAVIPLERNGYTIGKTVNRPATAIMAGLNVIADSIESYEELRPYIVLDDWQGGLKHCRSRTDDRTNLLAAQAHIEEKYGLSRIGELWRRLLTEAVVVRR